MYITIPAVLHQVQDNLVQELLHQRRSDPKVFQRLRREVGQLGLPTALITQRGIVLLADKNRKETRQMRCLLVKCNRHWDNAWVQTSESALSTELTVRLISGKLGCIISHKSRTQRGKIYWLFTCFQWAAQAPGPCGRVPQQVKSFLLPS